MCECTCGEIRGDIVARVGENAVLVIDNFPGCKGCDLGPSVNVMVFTDEGAREFDLDPTVEWKPGNYGGPEGAARAIIEFTGRFGAVYRNDEDPHD